MNTDRASSAPSITAATGEIDEARMRLAELLGWRVYQDNPNGLPSTGVCGTPPGSNHSLQDLQRLPSLPELAAALTAAKPASITADAAQKLLANQIATELLRREYLNVCYEGITAEVENLILSRLTAAKPSAAPTKRKDGDAECPNPTHDTTERSKTCNAAPSVQSATAAASTAEALEEVAGLCQSWRAQADVIEEQYAKGPRARLFINEAQTWRAAASELKAVLAALKQVAHPAGKEKMRDSERLDWLDQQLDVVLRTHESADERYVHEISRKGFTLGKHPDLRAAIDAALSPETPQRDEQ